MQQTHSTECSRIEENATYTAETHHILAKRQKCWFTILQLIPAIATAMLSALVAGQIGAHWVEVVTVIAAIVTAIGTVMNPQQSYYEHLNAAKAFTAIKHDARARREIFGPGTADKENEVFVSALHDRYNDLTRLSPPTEDWAFERARKRIQRGIHEPDAKD